MTGEILIKCESALETLAEFLKNHRSIFDGCMVDFITKDIFDKVLEKALQNDLLKLNQQEIIELPGRQINDPSSGEHFSLPFLPATPSSPSRTLEGLFELTTFKGPRLASCVASGTTEK